MVKCMKLLGNLSRGINPIQKRLLYRCCILPITLYGFQLWFYNNAPLLYHMKVLGKMQRRATIWILSTFKIFPSEGLECCSNHSSLKDKWSHNEQSPPMGYQVKSGEITRELDKELLLHCFSIYTTTSWSVLQQCVYLMSYYLSTCVFLKATMLPTYALTSYF